MSNQPYTYTVSVAITVLQCPRIEQASLAIIIVIQDGTLTICVYYAYT